MWQGGATYNTALTAARNAARDMAWDAARGEVWDAVRDAARDEVWNAVKDTAWYTAWGPILALIAYEDCAYMLDADVNEIKIFATLGDPRAVLLLPACIVFNKIKA